MEEFSLLFLDRHFKPPHTVKGKPMEVPTETSVKMCNYKAWHKNFTQYLKMAGIIVRKKTTFCMKCPWEASQPYPGRRCRLGCSSSTSPWPQQRLQLLLAMSISGLHIQVPTASLPPHRPGSLSAAQDLALGQANGLEMMKMQTALLISFMFCETCSLP